jgi:hypothetical protein
MKKMLFAVVAVLSLALWSAAYGDTLYVDNVGTCEGNTPCYAHPQDAVNAATPGDTILVYPGTYDSRQYTTKPPHWSANDQWAPALIVWKDNLTIMAVDPDPSLTTIQSTHNYWSNPVAIQASTGGVWNGSHYVGAGVYPAAGTAPSAVIIVSNNVTIDGFTLKRHFEGTSATYNTAGVFIGDLFAGGSQFIGMADGATVENSVFDDVWHAVYMWHTQNNNILNNTVNSLATNHWAAISMYDGYNDAQIGLGHLSTGNEISGNVLENKGIAVGAWAPSIPTDNSGTSIIGNSATQIGITYSTGDVYICNNTLSGGIWTVAAPDPIYCPNDLKVRAIQDIQPDLGSGDNWLDDRINEAIEHINNSLDPELWLSGSELGSKGKKVFDEEKQAAIELMKILKKAGVPQGVGDDAMKAIDKLVLADKDLASTAIAQAEAAACEAGCLESYNGQACPNQDNPDPDCATILDEIAKANEEMAKAEEDYGKGDYDKAIEHYKKAWDHAQHAMKKTVDGDGG